MIIQNSKGSDFFQINHQEIYLRRFISQKRAFVSSVLKSGQIVNADNYSGELNRVNQCLIEKYSAIVIRKGIFFQFDNTRPHSARRT